MGRNKELRSIIIKALVLGLVFLLLGTVALNIFINNINKNIIKRDSGIIGNLIEKYPQDKEEIVKAVTKGASPEEMKNGQEILESYGYEKDISSSAQPLLGKLKEKMLVYLLVYIVLFLSLLSLLIYFEYKKIYKKINKLSKVSEKVMDGDFGLYLEDAGEGDFNILNHQFNQMSGRLKNSLHTLQAEKVYLKDTISNISHQLKTPLSSLIILNDILLKDPYMEKDMRIDFLKKTASQLNRMEWLILNLLKLARIEAGSIEFKEETVLLKDVVDLSLNTLKPLIKDTQIEIKGDFDSKFIGDLDWTVEAIINIIKNGVEHGRGKLFIELEKGPLFTSIKIRDNGKGIDEKELKNIFNRFYKGTSSVKPESIGIGLNLSKLIVEAQDGTISVSSKENTGTEFIIRFLNKRLDKDILKL
ncbi:sensor histidine kinase [Tissierella sp.]|uniref:sensor histidine kinase n=1 Tax=Tissierella sp. TaxID=41274 RepID=UPI003F9B4086